MPLPATSPNVRRWIVCLLLFVTVAGVRAYYVEHFAGVLPFWDQWDAEGDQVIRPWLEGTFRLDAMWQSHNEHRIAPARILALLSFLITGVWSNLWEARINVVLAAAIPVLTAWLAFREHPIRGWNWAFPVVLFASYALPFGWENFLVGFQSQFYFVVLFTIAAMAIAAWKPNDIAAMSGVAGLCVAGMATLASGLLTPLAASCVYLLAWHVGDRSRRPPVVMVAALWLLAAAGYLGLPQIPGHAVLKAQGAGSLLDAASHILGWPAAGYHWTAIWLWLPGAITIAWMVLQRNASRADLMMAGCYAWAGAQALALAYGRGQGLLEVPSRYTDLLVVGLVANAWFALRFLDHAYRLGQARAFASFVAAMFFCVFFFFHALRVEGDFAAMQQRHQLSMIQAQHVSEYLRTRDPRVLRQPAFHIPYPDAGRLQQLLDNPALSGSLPGSVHNADPRPSLQKPAP